MMPAKPLHGCMRSTNLGFSLLAALWLGLWAGCAHVQTAAPAEKLAAAEEPKPVALPTLFIVGDSTVHNSGKILGWGDVIGEQFDTSRIKVINSARGGRSTRSFRNEGSWAKVLAQAKPGDFVFIQFGHNDSAELSDKAKVGRGTLPGTGPETAETTNTADGKSETVHTYGWYLTQYVTEAKAKEMTVVIFSPVPRNTWNTDGTFKHVMAVYTPWAAQIAKEQGVRFVDLESIVSARYARLGREKTKDFFPQDNTHTSPEGAKLNADCVIEGLKTLKDFPLNGYLKLSVQP